MKTTALLIALSLASCTSTKTSTIARTDSGKVVTEVTSQQFNTQSFTEILAGLGKAGHDIVTIKNDLNATK